VFSLIHSNILCEIVDEIESEDATAIKVSSLSFFDQKERNFCFALSLHQLLLILFFSFLYDHLFS
jgi:hypothetical protein